MTQLDVMYRYGMPPTEAAMMALGRVREVYGVRRRRRSTKPRKPFAWSTTPPA